jgi:hypothetical protein
VSAWRESLPPPFDKPSPPLKRRGSAGPIEASVDHDNGLVALRKTTCRRRRDSAPDAVDQVDRSVSWLRFIHDQHASIRRTRSEVAIEKLRR